MWEEVNLLGPCLYISYPAMTSLYVGCEFLFHLNCQNKKKLEKCKWIKMNQEEEAVTFQVILVMWIWTYILSYYPQIEVHSLNTYTKTIGCWPHPLPDAHHKTLKDIFSECT